MKLYIKITGADGCVKAETSGQDEVRLVYGAPYQEGDCVQLHTDKPGFAVVQLEDSLPAVTGYLCGDFSFPIPFGEKRVSYSPKCFSGGIHLLWARGAQAHEAAAYRNLALNPLDHHGNNAFFPHASANVETRGEAVFAARNAINGNTTSTGHGEWPYESWGINRREDAEIRIDFGRTVRVDRLVVTLRADFPHDNWWKQATFRFSDGSAFTPAFVKSAFPQAFPIPPREIAWLTMGALCKDETDPSPFPALVQLECWGWEKDPS